MKSGGAVVPPLNALISNQRTSRGRGREGGDLSVWVGEATLVWHASMRIYACAFAAAGDGVGAPQGDLLSSLGRAAGRALSSPRCCWGFGAQRGIVWRGEKLYA